MTQLKTPASPRLPDPGPAGVNAGYMVGFINVLRLYLNQVSNLFQLVFGPRGGQYVDMPNGVFFDIIDQTLAAINTATPVRFRQTYLSNGVRVNAGTDSRIYCDVGGVYNFQFSGQLVSNSASAKQVYIWIVRNGTDIGYSTHQYTLEGSSNHLNINWNFSIDMSAGDYLEMEWSADSTNITLEASAAASPHPGIPSAVMSVTYVAPLPSVLPTPP